MSSRKGGRMRLVELRKQSLLVSHGVRILASKRDALMNEFRGLVRKVRVARVRLEERMKTAGRSLLFARSFSSHTGIVSAALAAQRDIRFGVSVKNVWGVRIPSVDFPDARRGRFERGSAPGFRHPSVDETSDSFEEAINALVENAVAENRIMNIGGAVKTTTRRVNALEMRVAPEIKKEITAIQSHLEEMALEERSRLKRYKLTKAKRGATI